ncbi:lytic transglycosylase domain-containing protein [Sinanaerobacter sp. ZZT-01]|uniref:lytic transglycosylase domain-containing protein n=1 Tax=Sinanaerobacter sp. ZZT-01 TaxID=3111540 RepID=UPI002D77A430|nr:lytic transglycosylase domain-containing protein [Sinanaerobacter sp. ZZT-01]WRR93612.1 lytic transglycosylase domain-containing protein [Sinanaerobacter sp. ZZT-01]
MSKVINFASINDTAAVRAKERDKKVPSNFQNFLEKEMGASDGKEIDLDSIFERAAEEYQVPLNLLKAVAKAESNFNTQAISRCGAQGVMQLMPETAAALGVKDAFDPEQNIFGGANYLAQKLKQYSGDINLTLASYNAGSGNVKKYGGVPPFKETQNYINKVIGYMGENVAASRTSSRISFKTGDAIEMDSLEQISYSELLQAMLQIDILSQKLGSLTEIGDMNDGAE